GSGGASKTRRLITLISVGWRPLYWPPSGACLTLGTSMPGGLVTPSRVAPHRGCASADRPGHPSTWLVGLTVSPAPVEQGPRYNLPVLGHWPPPPGWRVCLGP